MIRILNLPMFALGLFLASVAFNAKSNAAPVPADHMTCEQAVSYYETYKRIYVIGASPKDIVPIYGMKPASQWRSVVCTGRNKSRHSYWVNTLDTDTCVIAVYCA